MQKKITSILLALILSTLFAAPLVHMAGAVSTLVVGTTDSIESSLDPALAYDYFGWAIIQNIGSGLVDIEPGSQAGPNDIIPALATNWTVTPDGLNWTFDLRHGVLFDDGVTEFNATHVKYSFDRALNIASPDGPQINIGYDLIIDSVEVVSKYRVKFNLQIPFAPFLQLLAAQASYIVNPEYAPYDSIVYYQAGNARNSTPMDLGPYKLTEWIRTAGKDDRIVLDANPYYWNITGGYPKTQKIIYEFYADSTALRLAIEGGDIDIAYRHLSPTDIIDLQDDPTVKVWEGTGAFIQYMVFQEEEIPGLVRLNDTRIRRAIAATLNRTELCETAFQGQSQPLYSIIPIGMMGNTEAFKVLGDSNYTYARSLLAELDYNETNPLEIELWYESSGHYPSSEDQAVLYKSQIEGSGVISVTLQSADWPSYRLNRNSGIMHVFVYGWYPDYTDPDDYAFLYWAGWLNHHFIDYGEHYSQMVEAYDAARNTTDAATRTSLYAQIDDYAVEDCPVVPLHQSSAWAVSKTDVQGIIMDISQAWRNWLIIPEFPMSLFAIFLVATVITVFASRKVIRQKTVQAKAPVLK